MSRSSSTGTLNENKPLQTDQKRTYIYYTPGSELSLFEPGELTTQEKINYMRSRTDEHLKNLIEQIPSQAVLTPLCLISDCTCNVFQASEQNLLCKNCDHELVDHYSQDVSPSLISSIMIIFIVIIITIIVILLQLLYALIFIYLMISNLFFFHRSSIWILQLKKFN